MQNLRGHPVLAPNNNQKNENNFMFAQLCPHHTVISPACILCSPPAAATVVSPAASPVPFKLTNTVFVFDFDCTLTSLHFFFFMKGFLKDAWEEFTIEFLKVAQPTEAQQERITLHAALQKPDPRSDIQHRDLAIKWIFGGQQRFDALKQFLEKISKYCNLYIASRGEAVQIERLLTFVGLQHCFPISAMQIKGSGTDKDIWIQGLLEHSHVIYVDDDPEEHQKIEIALKARPAFPPRTQKYIFFHGLIKNGTGLRPELMDSMAAKAQDLCPHPNQRKEPGKFFGYDIYCNDCGKNVAGSFLPQKLNMAFSMAANYGSFVKNPVTLEAIKTNRVLRARAAQMYQDAGPLNPQNLIPVKKFWSTQTTFFIQLFFRKQQAILEAFCDLPKVDPMTKQGLVRYLDFFIGQIQNKDPRCALLIKWMRQDNRIPLFQRGAIQQEPLDAPALFIQVGNAIKFARAQTKKGKRIVAMDAANQQRPGAGAYERGTLQEGWTRYLVDLYPKLPLDFRNVLSDLKAQNKLIVQAPQEQRKIDEEISRINVSEYQLDFLQLLLIVTKQVVLDESYLAGAFFRKDFFAAVNGIYGRLQNAVFEIPFNLVPPPFPRLPISYASSLECPPAVLVSSENPSDTTPPLSFFDPATIYPQAGFLRYCRFALDDDQASCTADLFQGGFVKPMVLQETDRILIVETAAPDRRELVGGYDRGCTFHADLQRAGVDEDVNTRMVCASVAYTLRVAIATNADIILLNGFGCGAFGNPSSEIARLMAKILSEHAIDLRGKAIYFMDLKPDICQAFAPFLTGLSEVFRINPYRVGNTFLSIVPMPLGPPKDFTILTAPTSAVAGDPGIRPHVKLTLEQKTPAGLLAAYLSAFRQFEGVPYKKIALPLIGTGSWGISIKDSIMALLNALREVSMQGEVRLYVPDQKKYLEVIQEVEMVCSAVLESAAANPAKAFQ